MNTASSLEHPFIDYPISSVVWGFCGVGWVGFFFLFKTREAT